MSVCFYIGPRIVHNELREFKIILHSPPPQWSTSMKRRGEIKFMYNLYRFFSSVHCSLKIFVLNDEDVKFMPEIATKGEKDHLFSAFSV